MKARVLTTVGRRGRSHGLTILILVAAVGFAPDASADQWMTTATGSTTNNGDAMSLTFGNGVTATYTKTATANTPVSCGGTYASAAGILSGTNVLAFLDPDPPAGSVSVAQCIIGTPPVATSVGHAFSFNKPVIAPILHLVNLDSSNYLVSGTTTTGGAITPVQMAKNNEMEVTGATLPTTFNSTVQQAINTGCEANDNVTNPNGACGSFRFGGGPVQNWSAVNATPGTLATNFSDGWAWSVSFQLARLTKAFGAASILSGNTTTLTFTIDNTNATNGTNAATATALSPLDFTDTFPAGLTIANATVSGTCAGAVFQDAGGGTLGAGDTGVRISGFTVPVNASCTLTVSVTASAGGTYTNTASNASSTIGNLVLAPNASLTVIAQPSFGTCDSRLWLEQAPNGTTPTTLYQIDTNANPLTFNPIGIASSTYNAVGYNTTDNYQYGLITNPAGNTLVRIGADGSAQPVGAVTGLPSAVYITGAFGTAGSILYVKDNTAAGTAMYAINVTTLTATPVALSAAINIADWAWVGGLLYGVTNGGQLVSVNPATGAVTNIGAPNGLPAGFFGAIYGAPNGLYGSGNNPPNGFYKFDLITGAATLISGAPGSQANDGSNCPTANITFGADLQITKTNTPASGPNDLASDSYTPGTARTYTVVVTNAGPFGAANAVFTDPAIANFTVSSVTCGGTTGGGVCPSVANTTVALMQGSGIVIPSLPYSSNTSSSVTFTVTGTIAAGASGALSNVANVAAGAGTSDATPGNNSATDNDTPAGTVVIVKDAVPNDAQDFAFTTAGTGLSAFSLDDDADGTLSNTRTFTGLEPGSYTVTEAVTVGWSLTALSCTDPDNGTAVDLANRLATIDIDSGETVTCTYTNGRQPILRLQKALPLGRFVATDQFDLSIAGSGGPATVTTAGSGSTATGVATLGSGAIGAVYSFAEAGAAGANLANYVAAYACANALAGGQTPSGSGASFSLTAAAGDDLTCTFSNTRNPIADLSISKTNTPGSGPNDQAGDTLTRGASTTYTIVVTNNGPDAVAGAILTDPPGSRQSLSCTAPPTCTGAACPAGLTLAQLEAGVPLGTLANGSSITVTLSCVTN
ncbi:DUF11 domain-containing protein [Lysobacter sp. BMK333-48F3]|uniref:beta strand repeat-containing protein n=1 Tax=Lysobacter sp. BMK333-48F3 TaxID=2867962 RepID=UPI001C8C1944|nr:DUF11 domain-containing protein [Lysobacter sp. BMK333-48F3]MBX9400232.1 DUF11 domain-containing protein [Lysobacter sp. BMK333-48F3]